MRFDWYLPFESYEYKLFYRMQSSLSEEFIKLYRELKARVSMNLVDATVGSMRLSPSQSMTQHGNFGSVNKCSSHVF